MVTFYGTGLTVDTSKPITVVTQFITDDGTDAGTLSDIKRFYVQDGKTIPNSLSSIAGVDAANSITDGFCEQQKTAFGDNNYFKTKGGLAKMGESLKAMVLVLSIVSSLPKMVIMAQSWNASTFYPSPASPPPPLNPIFWSQLGTYSTIIIPKFQSIIKFFANAKIQNKVG
ncbi:Exoglucanase 1 [Diaporthe eres]